ncbi:MAG: replicative DNA helicase [Clostridiales bacterium]|nr:replicative DNA helicase [Clostridiales bacterium]
MASAGLERIPPHNEDAEKSVLGAVLLDKDALSDVLEILQPEDFYNEMHQEIYRTIKELYRKSSPVDILTVSDELKKRKSLEMVGGRAYIALLSTSVPSTANAVQYAKIIEEKSVLRKLIASASDIMEKGYQEKMEPEQVLDYAEQEIFEIAQNRQSREYEPVREVLKRNIERINEIISNPNKFTGVPTGFMDLDNMTSGLQRSDLIILAARPSMGKTAFALNIAQNAALKHGAKVLVFSLEMSKEQLSQRLLAMESRIDMKKLRTGDLDAQDWTSISIAIDKMSSSDIYIDDTPGISAMELKNKCRRMKASKGLDLILIDYLQLMAVDGRAESRTQEISALTRGLKQLAREMDCPVVVLSQLSRAVEQRPNHRPMLSDLRESGSIEQDADIVLFLYRDDYYNKENSEKPGVCEVLIEKHRNGATGKVELSWNAKYTRFGDLINADRIPQ